MILIKVSVIKQIIIGDKINGAINKVVKDPLVSGSTVGHVLNGSAT